MEKERLQEFAARVSQANRSELVVVIYEATLASIEEGKKYYVQYMINVEDVIFFIQVMKMKEK